MVNSKRFLAIYDEQDDQKACRGYALTILARCRRRGGGLGDALALIDRMHAPESTRQVMATLLQQIVREQQAGAAA